jgi:hypothetical protein
MDELQVIQVATMFSKARSNKELAFSFSTFESKALWQGLLPKN